MHLWDRAMLPKTPGANERNDIQAKFAMRQRPASLLFGMIPDMVAWAGRGMTLIDNYSELEDALQGHHLPPTMIGHPQAIAALFTGLPKRRQGGRVLRLG